MQFRRHRLDNGLEIIAECNPSAYTTAMGFFVDAGSRDESDELAGVSHFLEHMAFKGTPHRSAEDVNRELDEMGSSSNARTSEERTIYHGTVLPEFQDRMVELLADIMRPTLREDDFEMEKQVIIEEIRMYDDQPPFGGHERIMAEFFGDHPLSRSVLGTVETVGNMTPEMMAGYFRERYSPGNITLVGAGNVDFDRFVEMADRQCGNWEAYPVERKVERASTLPGFGVLQKDVSAQEYLIQLADGPAAEDADRYATRILSTILGDDSGSRMYWEFIDSGVAEYAGMGAYEYQGMGVLMSVLCCEPDSALENFERLVNLQEQIQRDGVTARELELAQRKISAHVILQSERPDSRLFGVGSNWLQRGEYKTVREVAEAYQRVTLDDVHLALERYPLTRHRTLAIGPLDTFPVQTT